MFCKNYFWTQIVLVSHTLFANIFVYNHLISRKNTAKFVTINKSSTSANLCTYTVRAKVKMWVPINTMITLPLTAWPLCSSLLHWWAETTKLCESNCVNIFEGIRYNKLSILLALSPSKHWHHITSLHSHTSADDEHWVSNFLLRHLPISTSSSFHLSSLWASW